MSGALESSVTLDDVFVVVGARRVPLAPELAGYLTLEIAEGAAQAAGDVDPRSVYIGEEGTVALVVRPRREPATGDTEGSVRAILQRLLEASGSQTPALGSVARRKPSVGMNVLVEELEAALIPVNRAAGRRALARLAREVKRVTLGVGRNASLAPGEPAREAPRRSASPSYTSASAPSPLEKPPVREAPAPPVREVAARPAPQEESRPLPRSGFTEEPPTTAKRDVLPDPMAAHRPQPKPIEPFALAHSPPAPAAGAPAPRAGVPMDELPTVEVRKEQIVASLAARSNPPPKVAGSAVDEVDHLLASFAVSARGDHAARNELKALVGLEPTPPPPGSGHYDDDAHDDPRGPSTSESDVESLLANSDAVRPVARVSPPSHTALASPPTAISPALANEAYGGGTARSTPATVVSAISPPSSLPRPALAAPASPPRAQQPSEPGRAVPTSPSARRIAEMGSQPNIAPRADRTLTFVALFVLIAGGAALFYLGPSISGGHPAATPPSPAAAGSASAQAAAAALAARCHSALVVNDAPTNAEILIRVGQAPVDVERMPVGARLEFVATAEGFAPKRAVVPSGAAWDTGTDGKPRIEVPVQLDTSRARAGSVDSWPAGEPGSDVGGKGSPGTVHLVTTPRGAEVWLLAGLGPSARIDQLKCGGEVEVLVAGPTTLRKRLHVAEAAFVSVDGGADREATVSAK